MDKRDETARPRDAADFWLELAPFYPPEEAENLILPQEALPDEALDDVPPEDRPLADEDA